MNGDSAITHGTDRASGAGLVSWYCLGVILVVFIYGVADRAIFGLLAEQMRQDMGLSDLQLGLLQGVGLSLVAALASYPTAWLADRYDRRIVMAGCVVLWSLAVAGCALAPNFIVLLAASGLVGIGETGLGSITFALMPDLFESSKLPLANSIAAIGKTISATIGIVICGLIISTVEARHADLPWGLADWSTWRLSFLAAITAMPIGVVLLLTLPRRAAGFQAVAKGATAAATAVVGTTFSEHVRRHRRAILGFNLGCFFLIFSQGGLAAWFPVILVRHFGLQPNEVGNILGSMGLTAAGLGFIVGVALMKFLQQRIGARAPLVLVCSVTVISAIPIVLLLFVSGSVEIFVCLTFQGMLSTIAAMYYPVFLQETSPPHLRARVFSIFAVNTLIAGAISAPLVGWLSDVLAWVDRPLLTVSVTMAPLGIIVGTAIVWWSAQAFPAAIEDSRI